MPNIRLDMPLFEYNLPGPLVPNGPLRWHYPSPNGFVRSGMYQRRKLYEGDVELSLFYPKALTRRWGRIGGKHSRSIRRWVADGEELQRQVAHLSRRRQAHGYRLVQELRGAALTEKAA